MPLTSASTMRPSTSSTTAAARMMRPARVSSRPRAGEHLGGDADAGGDHRGAGEDALDARLAPERADDPQPSEEGDDDAGEGDQQRGAADLHQLGGLHFQADAEEEEHHAEVGEDGEDFVGRHPAEHVRADENAGENFADDARLAETLEDFRQELGGGEDQRASESGICERRCVRHSGHVHCHYGGTRQAHRRICRVVASAARECGAANNGVEVGWSEPASFSSVTATSARCSTAGAALDVHGAAIGRGLEHSGGLRACRLWDDPHLVGLAGGRGRQIAGDQQDALRRADEDLALGLGCPSPKVVTVVSAPLRIAKASLRRVSSMVCRRIWSRSARQFVGEVALACRRSRRRRRARAPGRRPGRAPSRSGAASTPTRRQDAPAQLGRGRRGRGRAAEEREHFARPFDSLHTDLAVAIQVRADFAALRLFGHADRVQLVMIAQFVAVHAGTTAPSSSRKVLQRRAHPGLHRSQRLTHALGHFGLREAFEVCQLDHLALVRRELLHGATSRAGFVGSAGCPAPYR